MPMFQTDAMWLQFRSVGGRTLALPVALKIGAGKINAVSGLKWTEGLDDDPQNYLVTPGQPWLDGFNVGKGIIRQFIAVPLGEGYTVEEQIDPDSDVGGVQIEAVPMKKTRYQELLNRERSRFDSEESVLMERAFCSSASMDMGLGMGGTMQQDIYDDFYGLDAWDLDQKQRCFVMLANAEQWMDITGEEPPLSPISAEEYSKAGLPWFDYFDADRKAIEGAKALGKIKSVKALAKDRGMDVWPDDGASFEENVKVIGPGKVSDGSW